VFFFFGKDVCNHQEHWKWWTQFILSSFRSQIITISHFENWILFLNIVYILYIKFQKEIFLYKENTISNCILKCEIRGLGILVQFIHLCNTSVHPSVYVGLNQCWAILKFFIFHFLIIFLKNVAFSFHLTF
jgi:hypothetical protein